MIPASNYRFDTLEEALDDLIEDWLEDESEEDIIAALLAKVEEMRGEPQVEIAEEAQEPDAADKE